MFFDRKEAGQKLAKALKEFSSRKGYEIEELVIVAIPRGGVVVAAIVAKALEVPLDLVIPRKIGAPGNPELAIGAVALRPAKWRGSGAAPREGVPIINEELKRSLNVSDKYIKEEIRKEIAEIKRRREKYLGKRTPLRLKEKVIILVDDGLATGYTALAAIKALREEGPKAVVLAVPVAPQDTFTRLRKEVEELICLETPEVFFAVGQFYQNFAQVTDEEVIVLLKEHQKKGKS